MARHLAEETAKMEIPEHLKRCALPQSVLQKLPLFYIRVEILLPREEAISNLRKQLGQLQMELSVHQKGWREFYQMTKQHGQRIQQIAFSANPEIKMPFYEATSVECVLAKAREVVLDIKILEEDVSYMVDELEKRSWEL
ncbi:MAG: hypothetical protein Q9204_004911 [Flavoplaca sp. TL-2023a]